MNKTFLSILLLALFSGRTVSFGTEIPYLTGRVNDNAHILSDSTRRSMSEKLKDHEIRTTNQVVVLTISSLNGESIEDYANKVFNEWKLGQKGKDNGVLVVVVPDEKQMRIEVGYGLEGIMPDLTASRIIQEIMVPEFRAGNYDIGITKGVNAILSVLYGESLPEIPAREQVSASNETSKFMDIKAPDMSIGTRILLGAFIFGIIGLFTVIGILTPGFGWFLYLFLIPFWAMFPVVVVGSKIALVIFIIYFIGYPVVKLLLKNTEWYKKAKKDLKTKGRASIGGFMLTSGGSGGSWSSGVSGGGFSGGGGSSGGGGASGHW
jgi:uncharacterized protein